MNSAIEMKRRYVIFIEGDLARQFLGIEDQDEQIVCFGFDQSIAHLEIGKEENGMSSFGTASVFPKVHSFPEEPISCVRIDESTLLLKAYGHDIALRKISLLKKLWRCKTLLKEVHELECKIKSGICITGFLILA